MMSKMFNKRYFYHDFRLMTGIEYELIHGQDPILYVIRKQDRHAPDRGVSAYCLFLAIHLPIMFWLFLY